MTTEHTPTPDPAIQIMPESEAAALRLAVIIALKEGVATDNLTRPGELHRASLLSVARRLGLDTTHYEYPGEPGAST
jgi:hypothetical protein